MGKVLALVLIGIIYKAIGPNGIYGALIAFAVCHVGFRCKFGYWWNE